MRTARCLTLALGFVLAAGCAERSPTEPAEPRITEARFAELRESAILIANRVNAAGEITATDRAEIEAIQRELGTCATAQDAARRMTGHPATGVPAPVTVAAPIGRSPNEGCMSCPFIIAHGNCIGVLRSSGPCRPGAGLERCFYNWYCYGSTA